MGKENRGEISCPALAPFSLPLSYSTHSIPPSSLLIPPHLLPSLVPRGLMASRRNDFSIYGREYINMCIAPHVPSPKHGFSLDINAIREGEENQNGDV